MRRFFEIYTFKRSGSHAVLNWLFNQFDEKVLYFNNCQPQVDPAIAMRVPDDDLQNIERLRSYYDSTHQKRMELHRTDHKVIACGYEERSLPDISRMKWLTPGTDWVQAEKAQRIMILRDVYNWLASREQRKKNLDHARSILMWKSYAREFHNSLLFGINYNFWVSSRDYRNNSLRMMNIVPRNDDVSFVPKSGGGSSFDGRGFKNKADKTEVLTRYQSFKDDEVKRLISGDTELHRLNRAIFGMEFPW